MNIFFRKKIIGSFSLISVIFVALSVGLVVGAQWYRLYLFPFPQLNEFRAQSQPNVEVSKNLVTTIYSKNTSIYIDRIYFDSIGDKRLEGLYLLQIPRHFSKNIRFKLSADIIIYRSISDSNNNKHYYKDNWIQTDILINIQGQNSLHDKVVKKLFPANNLIELLPGGPVSSDPIFIEFRGYKPPSLEFLE